MALRSAPPLQRSYTAARSDQSGRNRSGRLAAMAWGSSRSNWVRSSARFTLEIDVGDGKLREGIPAVGGPPCRIASGIDPSVIINPSPRNPGLFLRDIKVTAKREGASDVIRPVRVCGAEHRREDELLSTKHRNAHCCRHGSGRLRDGRCRGLEGNRIIWLSCSRQSRPN